MKFYRFEMSDGQGEDIVKLDWELTKASGWGIVFKKK